ncbi:MAG: hypothetical protein R3185_04240 [Candidatus Thermoplasmatota archaeon]|nr:hypothetical protein [Candidatus Thermoplasmatota archaeon]
MVPHNTLLKGEKPPEEIRRFWNTTAVIFGILAAAGAFTNITGINIPAMLGVDLYALRVESMLAHIVLGLIAWRAANLRQRHQWHLNLAYIFGLGLMAVALTGLLITLATGIAEALLAAAVHLSLGGWGLYVGTNAAPRMTFQRVERKTKAR